LADAAAGERFRAHKVFGREALRGKRSGERWGRDAARVFNFDHVLASGCSIHRSAADVSALASARECTRVRMHRRARPARWASVLVREVIVVSVGTPPGAIGSRKERVLGEVCVRWLKTW
jgi:hypothetical protein